MHVVYDHCPTLYYIIIVSKINLSMLENKHIKTFQQGNRKNKQSQCTTFLYRLHIFIYMTLKGMKADSIHFIGCGLNAVSADSIHFIGCGLNAVSADSIHLIGCGLNASVLTPYTSLGVVSIPSVLTPYTSFAIGFYSNVSLTYHLVGVIVDLYPDALCLPRSRGLILHNHSIN